MTQIDGMFPVRPNGVVISYIEVDGGALDSPYLAEYEDREAGSAVMETESEEYTMVVSRYEVRYVALDCGFGMGLLVGTYDNDINAHVRVEQVSQSLLGPSITHCFLYLE